MNLQAQRQARPPRCLVRFTRVLAGALLVAAAALGPAAGTATAAPPQLYVNGSVKPLVATCIAATEVCPNPTERHTVRSLQQSVLAYGPLTMHAEELGGPIQCNVALDGQAWNEHEGAATERSVRGYGVVEGLATSNCDAPGFLGHYEAECGCRLSAFLSAEEPLEFHSTEAEICSEAAAGEGHKALTECPAHSEREVTTVDGSATRGASSLPWKVELVHGYTGDDQAAVVERIGMSAYGECGPGSGEGTATCDPAKGQGRCYAYLPEGESYPAGCMRLYLRIPQLPLSVQIQGALEVTGHNGVGSAISPSFAELEGAASGQLQSGLGEVTLSGSVNAFGAEGQELLTAR